MRSLHQQFLPNRLELETGHLLQYKPVVSRLEEYQTRLQLGDQYFRIFRRNQNKSSHNH